MSHTTGKAGYMKGVYRVDPVAQPGVHRLTGHHPKRQVGVNGPQFQQDSLQNGFISGITSAIGAADDHTVPLLPGTMVAAQDRLIDLQLALDGPLDGEVSGGFIQQTPAQLFPQDGRNSQIG